MSEHLATFGSSSQRSDLAKDPLALATKPRRKAGFSELSLQQYTGTNVVQWHGKRPGSYAWEAVGPTLRIVP